MNPLANNSNTMPVKTGMSAVNEGFPEPRYPHIPMIIRVMALMILKTNGFIN
jgi:hypothetical protein